MSAPSKFLVIGLTLASAASGNAFNPLHHLGGNSPWFSGPEVTGISSDVPDGCVIDLASAFSRHGSRYPDLSAYQQWTNLSARIHETTFSTSQKDLRFLSTWEPVLDYPEQEITQLSVTGYKELYDMGSTYRLRYNGLYAYNTDLVMWANYYSASPRVRDSARLFARGFLGPNATELGTIYALNSSDPRSFMNSLATSDLCPAYADNGGSPEIDTWQDIYLPAIQKRLNKVIKGGFQFTQTDVSIIPYLCGFETQITGKKSPFCSIFTEKEILQYEYAQDLRYWYGTSLGTDIEKYMMLPVLEGLVKRFIDGPNATYTSADGSSFTPPKVEVSFTNDGQINELLAMTGVFDNEEQLPAKKIPVNRLFKVSNFVTMRGTVGFERLTCSEEQYMRIRLNEVVYPVANCHSGPGKSCPLSQYQTLLEKKLTAAGNFSEICNVTNSAITERNTATFFTNVTLPYATIVRP